MYMIHRHPRFGNQTENFGIHPDPVIKRPTETMPPEQFMGQKGKTEDQEQSADAAKDGDKHGTGFECIPEHTARPGHGETDQDKDQTDGSKDQTDQAQSVPSCFSVHTHILLHW